MRRLPSPALPPADAERGGWMAMFGLGDRIDPAGAALHASTLARLGEGWPFAVAAQLLAGAVLAISTARAAPEVISGLVLPSLAMVLAAVLASLLLALPTLRSRPAAQRVAGLLPATGALAVALFAMLWHSVTLPSGAAQLGSFVAVSSAAGITALVLQPVRAATLSFAAGLVLGIAVHVPSPKVVVVAGAFFICLAIATRRLARSDLSRAHEEARATSEGRFAARMIAEYEGHGTGWFWETDARGQLTYLSHKVAAGLGADPVGRPLTAVFRMDGEATATERTLAFHLSSRTSFSDYSIRPVDDGDDARCWSITGRPVTDDLGRFQGFIGSGSDLSEKRRSEAEITRLALFDSLTGLANRQRMRISLDKVLGQPAGTWRGAGLFLLDLDRFKAVNDTLGHQAGDQLLKQVAQRLSRGVGDAGLCGRLGGDEFQVLLPGMDGREPLAALARELIAGLSQPYHIAGQSVSIGCSIGVAIAPKDGADAETLVRSADLALYAAKGDGRGVHRFYAEEMLAGAQSRKELEDDLRAAVAEGGFHLCYQPVVATNDARIVGYEALIRWEHPRRGSVSPALFVPVAEECGLIGAIGEWVLRTACAEAATWPNGVRVAVNVSPLQFASPQLPALIASALAQSQLAPARLELEITEGVFLDQNHAADKMFAALKSLGVRLALDDFGTGYSSLGYLRTAPFDKIKIDQSFVKGAAVPGNRNAAIIRAIVTLADTLGMETTAEGVEIQDEIELVRQLGVSHIQGYVYGRPVRAEDAMRQLGADSGVAVASGHKISRAPRHAMLRRARVVINGEEGDVRIRNLSATGAMIDGIEIEGEADGIDVLIELLEDEMFPAKLRWAEGGRAGLELARQVNLDRLAPGSGSRARRLG